MRFDGSGNLKVPTSEEARINGSKGGRASAAARKKRRAMAETLEILLSMPTKEGDITDVKGVKAFKELSGKNVDIQTNMLVKAVQDYFKSGDPRILSFIRDTLGENPANKLNADIDLNLNVKIDYGVENGND